jgi:hypothetical protein
VNIHYIISPEGIQYVTTEQYRSRTGQHRPSSKGTAKPRTRNGIGNTQGIKKSAMQERIRSSSVYPGGKQLRRAMAILTQRQTAHSNIGKNTRGKRSDASAYNKPGSMKVRAR